MWNEFFAVLQVFVWCCCWRQSFYAMNGFDCHHVSKKPSGAFGLFTHFWHVSGQVGLKGLPSANPRLEHLSKRMHAGSSAFSEWMAVETGRLQKALEPAVSWRACCLRGQSRGRRGLEMWSDETAIGSQEGRLVRESNCASGFRCCQWAETE